MLTPFLRENLDILFVPLNPAKTSSDNGHYFSTNSALWNQLYLAGLITKDFCAEDYADDIVFGGTKYNCNNWNFGITDLLTDIVDSNSKNVKPQKGHCILLEKSIRQYKPKIVILLHAKVYHAFAENYCHKYIFKKNEYGCCGKLLPDCDTIFFYIPFPHGNAIKNDIKIHLYKELKCFLVSLMSSNDIE